MLKFCISICMITCFLLLKQKQNLYRIQCIYTVLKDLLIPVERLVIALQTNMISLKKITCNTIFLLLENNTKALDKHSVMMSCCG